MKKWWIVVIAILIIAVVGVFLSMDNGNIKKLEKEVLYFVETGYYKVETVTKGSVLKLEKLLKSDYKKITDFNTTLKNFVIEDYFTVANYLEDGYNFVKTKEHFEDIKEVIDRDLNELNKMLQDGETELKAEEAKLSKELKKKYKKLLEDSKIKEVINSLEKDKQVIEQKIDKGEEIIKHLLDNKNKWKIVNDEFVTLEDNFKSKYDKLIDELRNIGK